MQTHVLLRQKCYQLQEKYSNVKMEMCIGFTAYRLNRGSSMVLSELNMYELHKTWAEGCMITILTLNQWEAHAGIFSPT